MKDYYITIKFKSKGVKELRHTGYDDNYILNEFIKDNFVDATNYSYDWSTKKRRLCE